MPAVWGRPDCLQLQGVRFYVDVLCMALAPAHAILRCWSAVNFKVCLISLRYHRHGAIVHCFCKRTNQFNNLKACNASLQPADMVQPQAGLLEEGLLKGGKHWMEMPLAECLSTARRALGLLAGIFLKELQECFQSCT